LQEGALQAHFARAEKLRDRRQKLLDEIARFDALTLRRMEREEIIRGTLQWLFGPQFQLSPPAIATIIDSILSNATSAAITAGELEKLTAAEWSNVLSFGEFVKFLHQAVEWENVLFLLYPYFWGSSKLAKEKRFFLHHDPLHRDFVRAGFARVVLTIRPGFEQSFTQLLETGAFGTLPNNHPYMTIASEIEAYARTNFPGIPPANSEKNARPQLYPQQRSTWDDMQRVIGLLETFHTNNGKYPQTLAELPGGPFKDFWGKPYLYRMPGTSGEYDLISLGAEGEEGGNELDADISAAADASLVARWFDYTPTSGIDIQLNSGFAQIA
jgi:type II secretory pathway pseudopilin PulG